MKIDKEMLLLVPSNILDSWKKVLQYATHLLLLQMQEMNYNNSNSNRICIDNNLLSLEGVAAIHPKFGICSYTNNKLPREWI